MTKSNPEECCPPFDPTPWDRQTVTWSDRQFVKDRVRSIFHIPLNFAAVMKRNMDRIHAEGAESDEMIVLSHENSLWGADIYIAVGKDVPGLEMSSISGTFLTRVFEGPYRNMRKWLEEMDRYLKEQGKTSETLLFYYTTCPRCAKKYGKNYVVILAEII